jgi:hypothetical protein
MKLLSEEHIPSELGHSATADDDNDDDNDDDDDGLRVLACKDKKEMIEEEAFLISFVPSLRMSFDTWSRVRVEICIGEGKMARWGECRPRFPPAYFSLYKDKRLHVAPKALHTNLRKPRNHTKVGR